MAPHEGSFVRWQAISIAQLGFTNNLIITLAAATLGFSLTFLKDNDVVASCWAKCLLVLSIFGLLVSLAIGLWCALNRLLDFRQTAQNARLRERLGAITSEQKKVDSQKTLDIGRDKARALGRKTWALLYWQLGTFSFSVAMLVGSLVTAYHSRLF